MSSKVYGSTAPLLDFLVPNLEVLLTYDFVPKTTPTSS